MDWQAVPVQLSGLPILEEGYEVPLPNHFSTTSINDSVLLSIHDYLEASLTSSPWQPVSLTSLPGKEVFSHFVDLYFVHFDKFYPILHRPSFDTSKEPVLTLAVAEIGACYSGFPSARAFATSLSELTRRLLLFMAEYDPRFVRTDSYITAQLLQSIHGFSSGSKRLYELSDSNRSSIISHARSLKLFDHRSSLEDEGAEMDVGSRWEAWIRAEKARRLAWAICTLDASSTYFHNARSLLSMNELKMDLPCSTAHWQAETAQAWAALHPWTHLPPTKSLRSLLESLSISSPKSAEITDACHSHIAAIILARSIWDLRESALEPSALFFPNDNADLRLQRMQAILSTLQRLTSPLVPSANDLIGQDFASLVQRTYIVHSGGILTAEDAVDHMHIVWAKLGTRSQQAREHLLRWASRCPAQVRTTAHKAAQILSVARRYPYNHPNEPYHVFHSGFILWTMLGLLTELPSSIPPPGSNHRRIPCRLDWHGAHDTPEALAVNDWVEHGGYGYIVGMDGAPDLVSEMGMRQVLELAADTLKRMRVWGIAQIFLNAVLRALHD
ncbi:hypothetical protein CC80DRAFT_420478 [Byssothecium circinans]|uniref:Xylanolytic transcriptional activator regulatory domain-containing protein n=1 Tax=Byssothecium circinans TaxID=147558 RepID=A0A6A5TWM1_9PLEO|nr:hypothetical protein CC80DRAFT_420478 [Byssothecium circinans]